MSRPLMLGALGWLTFGAVSHFVIDVVSQHLRGVREPGPARTAYYGLHTAYPLSQLIFAAFGFFIAASAPELLRTTGYRVIGVTATLCWLAISLLFVEYFPPKLIVAIFAVLFVAAMAVD
jgi:hypothetical protein